jgi:ABC-type sulfate transport system substrate-binding protein
VNELAINMKYMVEEQKEQGKRLKKNWKQNLPNRQSTTSGKLSAL